MFSRMQPWMKEEKISHGLGNLLKDDQYQAIKRASIMGVYV
jgi:hypothetical protein